MLKHTYSTQCTLIVTKIIINSSKYVILNQIIILANRLSNAKTDNKHN